MHYKIVLDKRDHTSKGYGFIKFEHEASAVEAAQAMNGFEIWGAPCRVRPSHMSAWLM